jgi:hypothetical protein
MSKTSDLDMQIRQHVFNNLTAAKCGGQFERGGYLFGLTAEEISVDLVMFASDCENYSPNEVIPYIEEWLSI